MVAFRFLNPPQRNGCPILGAFLFLRQGWDSTNLNVAGSNRPLASSNDNSPLASSSRPPYADRESLNQIQLELQGRRARMDVQRPTLLDGRKKSACHSRLC